MLRLRGSRSNPNRVASVNTGADCPCVSACTVQGLTPEELDNNPSIRWTASHTPHGMNRENNATLVSAT